MTYKWHSGPPPHEGWWLTKHTEGGHFPSWRWWDGERWSYSVFEKDTPDTVAYYASFHVPEAKSAVIWWCDYWPENARVPRVDPRRKA